MNRGLRPAAVLLLALVSSGGVGTLSAQVQPTSYEQLQAFSSVLNYVRRNYVDSVGYTEMVRAGIEGVLSSLDPHSRFVSKAEWDRESALERGELAITGLVLEDVDSAVIVLAMFPGSPAAKAGIQPGDRISAVDDTTTAGQRSERLAVRLAGDKGSKVRVSFERGSRAEPDTYSVVLKREFIKPVWVPEPMMLAPGVGYVRLAEFGEGAADQLKAAIKKLTGQGATQIMLDLRNNPGGIVTESVAIASLFLPDETLVFRTRGRRAAADADFRTQRDGTFRKLSLIVLVNERSASASEALAGSLQDNDRALLTGRRTFGKALMQSLFVVTPTEDNIWLTIGRVISPSGRIIQRRYKGLLYEQYRALGGTGGDASDTQTVYHTADGRVVRGGGGILPDVVLPDPPELPVWWTIAADSGIDLEIADSVAAQLPATTAARAQWLDARAEWQTRLVEPYLARVRSRLHVTAVPDTALASRLGRILALRVADVRWGADAGADFRLHNDPDVRASLPYFGKLQGLLAGPGAAPSN
jgi:carboxyl-terminal processing protease